MHLFLVSMIAEVERIPFDMPEAEAELVEGWLEKYDVLQYVDDITYEKPRAEYYIDDKGIKFDNNWDEILKEVLWN